MAPSLQLLEKVLWNLAAKQWESNKIQVSVWYLLRQKQNYDQFIQSWTDFVHKFYTPTRKQSLGLHEEEHFHQSVTFGSRERVQLQTQQSTQEKSMRLANVIQTSHRTTQVNQHEPNQKEVIKFYSWFLCPILRTSSWSWQVHLDTYLMKQ